MQRQRGDVADADDEQSDALAARARADASTRTPVVWWLASSLFWLLFGSLLLRRTRTEVLYRERRTRWVKEMILAAEGQS